MDTSHDAPAHTVLEFFAGIGGLHYALRRSGAPHRVLCAYDVDDSAVRTYRHNFEPRSTPCYQSLPFDLVTRLASRPDRPIDPSLRGALQSKWPSYQDPT